MTGHDAIKIVEDLAESEEKHKRFDRASILKTAIKLLKKTAENEITKEIEVPICIACGSAISGKSGPTKPPP